MKLVTTREKGITLIALVVTIIVLLILAGISIQMLTGQNGILKRATEASTKTEHAEIYETLDLEASEYVFKSKLGEYSGSLIEYLLNEKHYIKEMEGIEGYIIDVKELTGAKGKYGNGTDGKNDVYKLEEAVKTSSVKKIAAKEIVKIGEANTRKIYNVVYYGKEGEKGINLGKLSDDGTKANDETETKFGDMFMLFKNEDGSITLDVIPTIFDEIFKEYPLTDEEIIMKENGIENKTWEEYMQELYNSKKLYKTAKEFVIACPNYWVTSDEQYSEYMNYLRQSYGEELSEEEIILKEAQNYGKKTSATTFEEYMQEMYDSIQVYKTAKEFLMNCTFCNDSEFNEQDYREALRNNCDWATCVKAPDGTELPYGSSRAYEYTIHGMGKYDFTIERYDTILTTFTVNIEQYEIVSVGYANPQIYDIKNNVVLPIKGGKDEWVCYYDKDLTGETIITPEMIESDPWNEGCYNIVDISAPRGVSAALHAIELESGNLKVKGYWYELVDGQ